MKVTTVTYLIPTTHKHNIRSCLKPDLMNVTQLGAIQNCHQLAPSKGPGTARKEGLPGDYRRSGFSKLNSRWEFHSFHHFEVCHENVSVGLGSYAANLGKGTARVIHTGGYVASTSMLV